MIIEKERSRLMINLNNPFPSWALPLISKAVNGILYFAKNTGGANNERSQSGNIVAK